MVRREGREDGEKEREGLGEKGREGGWCLITKSYFLSQNFLWPSWEDCESQTSV